MFALVHGAFHGGWCWEPLERELKRLGHSVVAPDLPCDDPDAGAAEYAEVVAAALAGERNAVVVGHSLGGVTIPLVPARRLVFLCALVPRPGTRLVDSLTAERVNPPGPGLASATVLDDRGRTCCVNFERAREYMYQDCREELARAAFDRLRPQALRVLNEETPLERMPETPSSYILCRDDRIVDPGWSRYAARELLGVEPIELDGGHSPMLAQPHRLADLLDPLAKSP
jgi:pimeloyl-ACP methyl ester carboxylesterase